MSELTTQDKYSILPIPALSNYPSAICTSLKVTLHYYEGNSTICKKTYLDLFKYEHRHLPSLFILFFILSLMTHFIYYPLKTVSQGHCKRNNIFLFIQSTGQRRSPKHLCHKQRIQEKNACSYISSK